MKSRSKLLIPLSIIISTTLSPLLANEQSLHEQCPKDPVLTSRKALYKIAGGIATLSGIIALPYLWLRFGPKHTAKILGASGPAFGGPGNNGGGEAKEIIETTGLVLAQLTTQSQTRSEQRSVDTFTKQSVVAFWNQKISVETFTSEVQSYVSQLNEFEVHALLDAVFRSFGSLCGVLNSNGISVVSAEQFRVSELYTVIFKAIQSNFAHIRSGVPQIDDILKNHKDGNIAFWRIEKVLKLKQFSKIAGPTKRKLHTMTASTKECAEEWKSSKGRIKKTSSTPSTVSRIRRYSANAQKAGVLGQAQLRNETAAKATVAPLDVFHFLLLDASNEAFFREDEHLVNFINSFVNDHDDMHELYEILMGLSGNQIQALIKLLKKQALNTVWQALKHTDDELSDSFRRWGVSRIVWALEVLSVRQVEESMSCYFFMHVIAMDPVESARALSPSVLQKMIFVFMSTEFKVDLEKVHTTYDALKQALANYRSILEKILVKIDTNDPLRLDKLTALVECPLKFFVKALERQFQQAVQNDELKQSDYEDAFQRTNTEIEIYL